MSLAMWSQAPEVCISFSAWHEEKKTQRKAGVRLGATVDGWNPANHPPFGWCWNPINNGINLSYQLVLAGYLNHQQYVWRLGSVLDFLRSSQEISYRKTEVVPGDFSAAVTWLDSQMLELEVTLSFPNGHVFTIPKRSQAELPWCWYFCCYSFSGQSF